MKKRLEYDQSGVMSSELNTLRSTGLVPKQHHIVIQTRGGLIKSVIH